MPTQVLNHQDIAKLNADIELFPQVYPVTDNMKITQSGVSRMVMLDRYAFKDTEKITLGVGDLVVLTIKEDPTYPTRGIGHIVAIDWNRNEAEIQLEESYWGQVVDELVSEEAPGLITRSLDAMEKPLELYYEQIAKRNARGLAEVETTEELQEKSFEIFQEELSAMNIVLAGRVLYGAGSNTDVTYFNCYVMPYVPDSREGIADHRAQVMEIMSRGGGVGTNGSTLRPRHTLARGVNGKSSGAVSWLDDIAKLTHLVEQGGSRRGAQMIMLADWHPDIIEFIISKMQNPRILRYLIENIDDKQIQTLAKEKLYFKPLTPSEEAMYQQIVHYQKASDQGGFDSETIKKAKEMLRDGGTYGVNQEDFLTGANISVTLTDDFMTAVEEDDIWTLRFPDVENYSADQMAIYNEQWPEVGDIREWAALGHGVKEYRQIPARSLWQLITICATYSAEPGIFYIDNANQQTNATAYGQKVVATNPCGEQPLAPYSVCNLAAINLANMADKDRHTVDFQKLKDTVKVAIRMQDNVIDATPYFLEANRLQALGERRIGLGVMGLADLLIYANVRYGSVEAQELTERIFYTMAVTAYETSISLAREKGTFPFLVGDTEEETRELRQQFIHSGYMQKMPDHIRQDILAYGIRNSHLLTVAPTGSTGTMVGVATGLEPYYAFKYYRSGRLGKFIEVDAAIVEEYLTAHPDAVVEELPEYFVSAMELSPEEHVDMQTTIQKWVDSSISKTVNAPKGYSVSQVAAIYGRLYKGGAKGGTVYVDGSRDSQVLTLKAEENTIESEMPIEAETADRVVDDKDELKQLIQQADQEHIQQSGHTDDVVFGSDIGDTCPICRQGIVEDLGGCNTCTNCQAQLRCGL